MTEKYFVKIRLKEKFVTKIGLSIVLSKIEEIIKTKPVTDRESFTFANFDYSVLSSFEKDIGDNKDLYYIFDITRYVRLNNLDKDSAFARLEEELYDKIGQSILYGIYHVTSMDEGSDWNMVRKVIPNKQVHYSLGL